MNINPVTGKTVTDWEEYAIRFKDAVLTPLDHRLKRRNYGSKLHSLQGKSVSPTYLSKCAAYVAECYYNPICNLRQAELIRIVSGVHVNGFKISVIVRFNGRNREISL